MDMLTGWIAALNGEPVGNRGFAQGQSLGIGHHRFAGLPDYVPAPEIDYHYVSVTLGGPIQVEGILSGGRMAADVRLAIENHDRFSSDTLAWIVQELGPSWVWGTIIFLLKRLLIVFT